MSAEDETRKKRRKSHESKEEVGSRVPPRLLGPWSAVVALARESRRAKELRDGAAASVAQSSPKVVKGTSADGTETDRGTERRMSGAEAEAGQMSGGKRSRAELDGGAVAARSEWRGTLLGTQSRR